MKDIKIEELLDAQLKSRIRKLKKENVILRKILKNLNHAAIQVIYPVDESDEALFSNTSEFLVAHLAALREEDVT